MQVEPLCQIDIGALVTWAEAIPANLWPQEAGSMHGIEWRDAAEVTAPYLAEILLNFPRSEARLHYFSMIWPGHSIGEHTDYIAAGRLARVHVPILTNPGAHMSYADEIFHMKVGQVYTVNPEAPHSVHNAGTTPRLHWLFDVFSS